MASIDDFCAGSAAAVGFPNGELLGCTENMPGMYWVRVVDGATGFAGAVIVDSGQVVTDRGYAVGAAWLKRIAIYDVPAPRSGVLAQGMEAIGALPAGFTANDVVEPLAMKPFRMEFVADEAEPAEPAGGGGGGRGRGPGRTPTPQKRAVLTGDDAYNFTVTFERRESGGAWQSMSTEPWR